MSVNADQGDTIFLLRRIPILSACVHVGKQNERTSHYFWSQSDLVGAGSTADVYRAYRISDGETVAAKVFHAVKVSCVHGGHLEASLKELVTLQRLSHENVIKLLDVDVLRCNRDNEIKRVLIMEYCFNGSLQSYLECSENFYGLKENEFVVLVKHLATGMKYLRSQNVIHRDIKPSNIMVQLDADGSHTFKLADFGAAKQLLFDFEEGFQSLVGTAEYLPPPMFEYWVSRDRVPLFKAESELWTIGVTLYQSVTGHLPFRPYLGVRKDYQTMLKIIKDKPKGYMSGVQPESNAQIQYFNQLPASCNLSPSLKKQLETMIMNLMDAHMNDTYKFEHYFEESERIFELQAIHVLDSMTLEDVIMYCPNTSTASDLLRRLVGHCRNCQCPAVMIGKRIVELSRIEFFEHDSILMLPLGENVFAHSCTVDMENGFPFCSQIPEIQPIKRVNNVRDAFNWAREIVGNMCRINGIVKNLETVPKLIENFSTMLSLTMQHEIGTIRASAKNLDLALAEFHAQANAVNIIKSMFKINSFEEISSKDQKTVDDCIHMLELISKTDVGVYQRPLDFTNSNTCRINWSQKLQCQYQLALELLAQFENETKIQHFNSERTCAHISRRKRIDSLRADAVNTVLTDFSRELMIQHKLWQDWFSSYQETYNSLKTTQDVWSRFDDESKIRSLKETGHKALRSILGMVHGKLQSAEAVSFQRTADDKAKLTQSGEMLRNILIRVRELDERQQSVDETLTSNEIVIKKIMASILPDKRTSTVTHVNMDNMD